MIQYLTGLDNLIFQFIYGFAGKTRFFDWLGIFFAQYLAYFLILVFLILVITEKNWQRRAYYFSFAALSVLLSRGLLIEIIRYIIYRPRPFLVLGITPLINHNEAAAFPSGHAAVFFALSLATWYFNRRWGYRFLVASLLMGFARVFTGVHWPFDIVGGIIVGFLSVIIIKTILPSVTLTNKLCNPKIKNGTPPFFN
jgi:undecaprenyl-diphosphatase